MILLIFLIEKTEITKTTFLKTMTTSVIIEKFINDQRSFLKELNNSTIKLLTFMLDKCLTSEEKLVMTLCGKSKHVLAKQTIKMIVKLTGTYEIILKEVGKVSKQEVVRIDKKSMELIESFVDEIHLRSSTLVKIITKDVSFDINVVIACLEMDFKSTIDLWKKRGSD